MFSLIWRFFPGPGWFRVIVMLGVLAGLVYVLITWGYPWVATVIPEPQSTIEGLGTSEGFSRYSSTA